jgi:hypothetical protein
MKNTAALIIGLVFIAAKPVFAQVPSATRSTTNQSSASAGRFGTDIDSYMGTRNWPGMEFNRHFFFIGGRYQGTVTPALGYATRLGNFYLGVYFRGTVVQGDNTHHNGVWDSEFDTEGNGSSSFRLDDTAALLFGVPGIGGFRFDWIASDPSGTANPRFEQFNGVTKNYNGNEIAYAQGIESGSMAFLLSYGNVFFKNIKVDATIGYATSDTIDVTGGQIDDDIFKFNQTQNSKIYIKLGGGYNLNDTSSVDGDYSLIIMPGLQWEQTIGDDVTSSKAEGNVQHIFNLSYSKTFNFDDKISARIKPNLMFDFLLENGISETESGKIDYGRQTTIKIIPSVAMGLEYKASPRLRLYTGTTIQLFDYAAKNGEKGADGINATYSDGSRSDIIQGSESGFDIGASFALTDTLSLDFNARTLINSIFVAQLPMVDLFLTFKPGFKTSRPAAAVVSPAAVPQTPSPARPVLPPEPDPAPVNTSASEISVRPQDAGNTRYEDAPAGGSPAAITTPVSGNASMPEIIVHPKGGSYRQYADVPALSVTAVGRDGGSLSYQWFVNTRNSNSGGIIISGAVSADFTPATSIPGTIYYYAVVTNTNPGAAGVKTSTATSEPAVIIVTIPFDASAPEITAHPRSASYTQYDSALALSVTAASGDSGSLSYQWFVNTRNSNIGGTRIAEAASAAFIPPTSTLGTAYYYAVVTNTNPDATGIKTTTAISEPAAIIIMAPVR